MGRVYSSGTSETLRIARAAQQRIAKSTRSQHVMRWRVFEPTRSPEARANPPFRRLDQPPRSAAEGLKGVQPVTAQDRRGVGLVVSAIEHGLSEVRQFAHRFDP